LTDSCSTEKEEERVEEDWVLARLLLHRMEEERMEEDWVIDRVLLHRKSRRNNGGEFGTRPTPAPQKKK